MRAAFLILIFFGCFSLPKLADGQVAIGGELPLQEQETRKKAAKKKIDDKTEPPLKFVIEIDGQKINGEIGKPFKLNGNFKDAKTIVKTSDFREFNFAGISFQYPAAFQFEADVEDLAYKMWLLTGVESTITVYEVVDKYDAEGYAKERIEDFDTDDFEEEEVTLKMGDKKLTGIRMVFKVDEYEYVEDIFDLPKKNGKWRLLVLSDVAPDRDPDSTEQKNALELIEKSLKVK
jgi:hypothetical protein